VQYEVIQGDCISALKEFDDNTFDSIVTDPPYALSFMGKDWDSFGNGQGYQAWCESWARELLRVLKPGGYLLAFGGTRTYHRLACAIEDAGFEIRDSLHWIYGSGFPKSRDISKAIDSEAGAEREVIGKNLNVVGRSADRSKGKSGNFGVSDDDSVTAPATEAAKAWAGWGTALKPAHEPIVMARKPLAAKTVAANVLEFGTGGINIDGCRIIHTIRTVGKFAGAAYAKDAYSVNMDGGTLASANPEGRWPPNVVLSDEAAEEMDRPSGITKSSVGTGEKYPPGKNGIYGAFAQKLCANAGGLGDTGGASRFFPCFKYQAKASKKERPVVDGIPGHPTVKPVALMQWLVRLVTPQGGYVLDPFAGTGTTAEACELEGFDCLLIERDADSIRRINKRMSKFNETEAI
jgi:DNA modification methylase